MTDKTITLHDGTVLHWESFDNTRETWALIVAESRHRIEVEERADKLEATAIELGGAFISLKSALDVARAVGLTWEEERIALVANREQERADKLGADVADLSGVGARADKDEVQIATLEAIVVELGGVGALPIEGEESAAVRLVRKLGAEREHWKTIARAMTRYLAWQDKQDRRRGYDGLSEPPQVSDIRNALKAARTAGLTWGDET